MPSPESIARRIEDLYREDGKDPIEAWETAHKVVREFLASNEPELILVFDNIGKSGKIVTISKKGIEREPSVQ